MSTAVTISPSPILQFLDNNGRPSVGGAVLTQVGGVNTATYQDSAGTIALPNPIPLNNRGEISNAAGASCQLFLQTGFSYTFTLFDSAGNQLNQASYVATSNAVVTLITNLASSIGSTLVGFLQAGVGAVLRTLQSKLQDTISVKDFGAVGDGLTDDTAAIQAAITALLPGQTLIIADDHKLTGAGLTILNKNRVTFTGGGRLKLVGANVDAVIFNLSGTCDDVKILNLRFEGDGNAGATYFQYGVYNLSGQTLSNVTVSECHFKNLNAAISFNADTSGTYTNAIATNNVIEDMLGTLGGQGYGIHESKATNVLIQGNLIMRCSRHSIYAAKSSPNAYTDYGVLIHDNIIRDHRLVGHDASTRPAIFITRGFGYSVKNNTIINYFDGGCAVAHDDDVAFLNAGDAVIENNVFTGRQNAVSSLWVGKTVNQIVFNTSNVRIVNNDFRQDLAVGGNGIEVEIINGLGVDVIGNHFYAENIPNVNYRPVQIGSYSASGATALDQINVNNNVLTGTSAFATPIRFVYVFTGGCTIPAGGASRINVFDNQLDTTLTLVGLETQVAQTNNKLVFKPWGGKIVGNYVAGTTNPSVYGGVQVMTVTNAGATTISTFTDVSPYQEIALVFTDSNTTINNSGNIRLTTASGGTFTSTTQDSISFQYSNAAALWIETSRSVNG